MLHSVVGQLALQTEIHIGSKHQGSQALKKVLEKHVYSGLEFMFLFFEVKDFSSPGRKLPVE
jgi:hypothetical protein